MGALEYVFKGVADMSQHDRALKQSADQVYQYKKRVETAKNSMGNMLKTFGKFAGGVGVAMGAMDTFKKILTSTEQGTDAFARTMETAKTSINQFYSSLTNGTGVSSFLKDLGDIKKAAEEAYNAIDDLGTMKMWNTARINTLKAQIAENRVVVNSSTASKEDREKAQKEIDLAMEKIQALTGDLVSSTMNAYYKKINEISGGNLDKHTADWLMTHREANDGVIKKRIEELNKQYRTEKTWVQDGQSITGASFGHYEYTYSQEWVRKTVDQFQRFLNATDTEIQEILNLQNEASALRTEVAAQQAKNDKLINKNVGGGSGSSIASIPDVKYLEGTIGYYEDEISKLRKQMLETTDNVTYQALQDKIDELQQKINEIKGVVNTKYDIPTGPTTDADEYYKNLDAWDEFVTKAQQSIDAMGSKVYDNVKSISSSLNELYSVFESFQSLADGDADFGDYFKTITSGIFGTIDAITSLITAIQTISAIVNTTKAAEAIVENAKATASVTEMAAAVTAFYAAMGPAGIAPAAATIAAYKALIEASKFAGGGIVGGTTTVGDYNLARVNKGEMILNQREQTRLWHMLSGVGASNLENQLSQVRFHISGNDLVGTLTNYNNKKNRVQ